MGEYSFLLLIALVFMVGTISPGPSFILVAKTAVSRPFSEGIGVSLGLSLGAVFFTLLAIFGLPAIVSARRQTITYNALRLSPNSKITPYRHP